VPSLLLPFSPSSLLPPLFSLLPLSSHLFTTEGDTESDYAQNLNIERNWIRNADYFTYGGGTIDVFLSTDADNDGTAIPVGEYPLLSLSSPSPLLCTG
jgi:hypothetical protein